MRFPAIVERVGHLTVVDFPDCPGCRVVAGEQAEAVARAKDSLRDWLEEQSLLGIAPPRPSSSIDAPASAEVLWVVVSPALFS